MQDLYVRSKKNRKTRSHSKYHRKCRSSNSVKKLWKGENRGRYPIENKIERAEKCPINSSQELMKADNTLANGKA